METSSADSIHHRAVTLHQRTNSRLGHSQPRRQLHWDLAGGFWQLGPWPHHSWEISRESELRSPCLHADPSQPALRSTELSLPPRLVWSNSLGAFRILLRCLNICSFRWNRCKTAMKGAFHAGLLWHQTHLGNFQDLMQTSRTSILLKITRKQGRDCLK